MKKLACLVLLLLAPFVQAKTTWQSLAKGLDYAAIPLTALNIPGKLHAFRVDLHYYHLDLAFANEDHRAVAYVDKLAKKSNAVLAVNGGFFSPDATPLGLRIKQGTIKSPIKKTAWWGVFYIKDNIPHLSSQRYFQHQKNISFAVQAGPRLIVDGYIPKLKPGFDERTALGIDKHNRVLVVASDDADLTTSQLANLMRKPYQSDGLSCIQAINLDGGRSSQLYANINGFSLHVANFSPVTDAVLIVPNAS